MEHVTNWRKASYSGTNGGNCVEVADDTTKIAVRDSQNQEGAHLVVPPASWSAFTRRIKRDTQ
jgi:hypothetical protein